MANVTAGAGSSGERHGRARPSRDAVVGEDTMRRRRYGLQKREGYLTWRFVFLPRWSWMTRSWTPSLSMRHAALAKIPFDRVLLCLVEFLNLQAPIPVSYSLQSSLSPPAPLAVHRQDR